VICYNNSNSNNNNNNYYYYYYYYYGGDDDCDLFLQTDFFVNRETIFLQIVTVNVNN